MISDANLRAQLPHTLRQLDPDLDLWVTNYVAAGGFIFAGSSAFTRGTNGGPRPSFALATAMGVGCNPAAVCSQAPSSATIGLSVLMPHLNYSDAGGNDVDGEQQYFTMPLLGPLMIIPGAWIQSWKGSILNRVTKIMLVAVLCFQAYAANFGISWLPEGMVLLPGYQGSLRWDWNLYLQNYFGIFGRPRKENWKQDEILGKIADDAKQRAVPRMQ